MLDVWNTLVPKKQAAAAPELIQAVVVLAVLLNRPHWSFTRAGSLAPEGIRCDSPAKLRGSVPQIYQEGNGAKSGAAKLIGGGFHLQLFHAVSS